MTVADHHDETTEGEAAWLWPLYAFIALIAAILDHITKLKSVRSTHRFRSNWRDSWPDLRQCEWLRDQVVAHGVASLLAGRELDLNAVLVYDIPADYGGPCPRNPFVMNRRFLALAQFAADPEGIVRKRFRRVAKQLGLDPTNPLALHGRDAAQSAAAHHEPVAADAFKITEARLALTLSSARSARPSICRAEAQRRRKDERGLANARGPPTYFLLTAPHLSAPATENAPARLPHHP